MSTTTAISPASTQAEPTGGLRPGRDPLIALMGAGFDTGNLGVSALASGTISAVRRGFPNARVILLDYARQAAVWSDQIDGQPVSIGQINLRFSKQLWLPNHIARLLLIAALIRLIPVPAWRRRLIDRDEWLRRISEADCHLSLAGGDSFSDIYGARRLVYMALPQLLILLLEKPLILPPQTYGPFQSGLSRLLARMILRRARGVYSRDRAGLAIVAKLQRGRGPRPQFSPDLGFALEPLPPSPAATARLREIKARGPLVGFNVSGLLYIGGYGGDNSLGLKGDYVQTVRALLDMFVTGQGVQVLLVPHVYGEGKDLESDLAACQAMMRDCDPRLRGHIHLLPGRFDHHETKALIGECDFFVGSRMHACIAALSQSIPAVGLAYSRKFAGVMELAGNGARVLDLRTMGTTAVVANVIRAWREREDMGRQLLDCIPAIRSAALGWFSRPEFEELFPQRNP